MRRYLFIFFVSFSSIVAAQPLDFCNYFSLSVKEIEYDGEKLQTYSPDYIQIKNDKYCKFINKHQLRFDYIFFQNASKFKGIASYFPDTTKIHQEFCRQILQQGKTALYLLHLSPEDITQIHTATDTFTVEEMMQVTAKFFYCDGINTQDTTIQTHVCVGINGTDDLKLSKDVTLLEAFSIEAIFHYLQKNKTPEFYTDFITYQQRISKKKRNNFNGFEDYLKRIRKMCYEKMETNEGLKRKLLRYYHKNRENLNFVIV